MTDRAARAVAVQALQANIEAARRLAANARTRRSFAEQKKAQAYWEAELARLRGAF